MYDAREKAIRDRKWEIDSAKREGKIEMVRMLQELLYVPLSDEQELRAMNLEQIDALSTSLQEKLRSRTPS